MQQAEIVWKFTGVDRATLEREIEAQWATLRDPKHADFREDAADEGVDLAQIDKTEDMPFQVSGGNNLNGVLEPIVVKIAINVVSAVAAKGILAAIEHAWRHVIVPAVKKGDRAVTEEANPDAGSDPDAVDTDALAPETRRASK